MSYPSIALNLSNGSVVLKPKPRYTSSDEERNSLENVSPSRQSMIPASHLYTNPYERLANPFKYFGNYPCYPGLNFLGSPSGIEGNPTRPTPSVIPCNFECGFPHVRPAFPPVVNGSHPAYHPYLYSHMKVPGHLQGFDPFFYANLRKPKRVRTAFSPTQLLTLEKSFEKNHYAVGSERKQLSKMLGLSETQVKVWFQNRRTKHKRQKQEGQNCSQKTNDKDCLDSREMSSEEPSTSETSEDDDEETGSCKTSSSSDIDVENSLLKCQKSSPEVSTTEENSSKTLSNTIWNPMMLNRTC